MLQNGRHGYSEVYLYAFTLLSNKVFTKTLFTNNNKENDNTEMVQLSFSTQETEQAENELTDHNNETGIV